MPSHYACSFSSLADKTYGAACWQALVESCHKTLDWTIEVGEQDIETSLSDATVATTTTSTIAAPIASPTIDTTIQEIDFLNGPYVSFDWTLEDEEAPSTCPSLVSAGVQSLPSKSTTTRLGPNFALGRFMETISEESEEEEEEELMIVEEDEVDVYSESETDIATPPPSIPDSDRDERYRNLQNPTFEEVDALFDILSDKRVMVMKTLGIYTGFMRRSIVVKLPDPNAKLRRISRKRDTLNILAWAASTQEYAPLTNLDLLASCC